MDAATCANVRFHSHNQKRGNINFCFNSVERRKFSNEFFRLKSVTKMAVRGVEH